jgi:hypothetical protein
MSDTEQAERLLGKVRQHYRNSTIPAHLIAVSFFLPEVCDALEASLQRERKMLEALEELQGIFYDNLIENCTPHENAVLDKVDALLER